MFHINNNNTKQAIVGAAIALAVALVSFIATGVYNWTTSASNLKISKVYPIALHDFSVDDSTVFYFKHELPNDIIEKQAMDSLILNFKKNRLTQDEVDFDSETIKSLVSDCQTGIYLCNVAVKYLTRNLKIKPPKQMIDFLGMQASESIIRKPRDSINFIVSNYLQEHLSFKSQLDRLYRSLSTCRLRHCAIWQFKLDIMNAGNVPGYISQDAVVQLGDKAIPYVVSNNIKDGVPMTTPIPPIREGGSVLIFLKPAVNNAFQSEQPESKKSANTDGRLTFEIRLKTLEGRPLKKIDSLSSP